MNGHKSYEPYLHSFLASDMLSRLSQQDLNSWRKGNALRTADVVYKTNVRFKNHVCNCVALVHTSMRNSNVKRRIYGNYKGHEAEVQMLIEAL